jgi:hypothetical protein
MSSFATLFALVLVAFTAAWLWDRNRSVEIRNIATTLGFHVLGETLPGSLNLDGTPMQHADQFANVIDGEINGIRVVAFDYTIGTGKARWVGTAIAAKNPQDLFGPTTIESYLVVKRCGEWAILYQPAPRGLLGWQHRFSAKEIAAHIASLPQ